jgi:D-inositol-3-phosphate glycosyltransferase
VAGRLGERGLKVDVFTRAAGEDRPPIVEVNEHTRVIHVPAGPAAPVAKEDLLDLVHTFGECLDNRIGRYDLIHSHYWLSGMVARGLKARHDIPIVHTMHTMAESQ